MVDAPVQSLPTEGLPEGLLAPGQVLGDRYQIRSQLGRGGMGEVWRAFDLKLRVEVALKAMRVDLFKDERRRDLLRREVRAAREVVSPNVCRIFDLVEAGGIELVSMEYVDGGTLLDVLRERGPLDLKEAQDIASQFLAGLEAIHKAGLVHRDIKPENIMLTRAGRVVVMDFGLARQEDSGAGTVSGTPAYMAPEQAAGLKVDARADVYAAGVVLAEMVSPGGIKSFESRQSVWEGVRSEPCKLPDTPWAPVLKKAVAKEPANRYNSAHTLIRALEDVTLRVEGAEDLTPYPGLASFTEEDAEYFFGREAEIEAMWAKLERPHLLALIGPSGAGKSSFIRAGLIPAAPAGWSCVVCTPGNAPFITLGQAMAREMAGDADAMQQLLRFEEGDIAVELLAHWRERHQQALLIVDQFEELFTQNPGDVQSRFAMLLGCLALEADVHVLLSMRDDFLIRCHGHRPLAPLFDSMTPLGPPIGPALRRALVQPAMKCGYRFEDDDLVEEMLAEVEGERGALPLLAFALARLWKKRDRDNGLLTRQTYQGIGGVGGALAQHAEATIDRIGSDRISIVREIFRNLVTAEGTRAVREWDELLSVFDGETGPQLSSRAKRPKAAESRDPPKYGATTKSPSASRSGGDPSTRSSDSLAQDDRKGAAQEVLRELIDARLLTSYEVHEEIEETTRRVEIIHESLLANWPRLVRWQTQDADSAQLRDQLRQAARTWDEHDRSDDMLWTGSAYREFASWRERYPGGLTDIEGAFSSAMTAFARRRRRRRRVAVAAALVIAAVVSGVTTALWRRSVLQERRAEAQKLIALGKVLLEDYPTAALAHATQSLELADTEAARFLALEALWEGPTAFVVNETPTLFASFSRCGNWLVQSHDSMSSLAVISSNGRQHAMDHPTDSGKTRVGAFFGARKDLFFSWGYFSDAGRIALWSAPEARLLASAEPVDDPDFSWAGGIGAKTGNPGAVFVMAKGDLVTVHALHPDGRHERLGKLRTKAPFGRGTSICRPPASGEWFGIVEGNDISIIRVGDDGLSGRLLLGRHEGDLLRWCEADPLGHFLMTATESGEIRRWDVTGRQAPINVDVPRGLFDFNLSNDGSHLCAATVNLPGEAVSDVWIWSIEERTFRLLRRLDRIKTTRWDFDPVGLRLVMTGPQPASRLWSLGAPAGAAPIVLRRGPANYLSQPTFSPDGRWVATCDQSGLTLWPLARPHAAVIRLDLTYPVLGLVFGPEGRFLATSADGKVSILPLEGPVPIAGHTVFEVDAMLLSGLAVSANGQSFVVGSDRGKVWVGRDDGEAPRQLPETETQGSGAVTFSPDGRFVASLTGYYDMKTAVFRVWDVQSSNQIAVLSLSNDQFRGGARFTSDGRLLTGASKGVVAWDVETGDHQILVEADVGRFVASDDGRRFLVTEEGKAGLMQDPAGSPVYFDLDKGVRTRLETHGLQVRTMAMDRDGTVAVTGDVNGVIRVGPVTGEAPHLLLGHDGAVRRLAVDPLGRWIASAGQDNTIRLWPMPDLSKPPLHTLPREELIAKLKSLTNVRVVRDEESATGWTLTHDPFPGWETVPTW